MILGVIIGVVAVVAILIAAQPDTFRYERSVTIQAPASVVFPHVNDFRRWADWSPWEKVDPNVQRTYGGAEQGVGATYAWVGNKQLGSGNMQILESVPGQFVKVRLEFTAPMKAVNTTEFVLSEHDGVTTLKQAMYGQNPFIGKVFALLMNMEKMIGSKFEEGLSTLKQGIEEGK